MPSVGDKVVMLSKDMALQVGASSKEIGIRVHSDGVQTLSSKGRVEFDDVKRDNPSGSWDNGADQFVAPEPGVYLAISQFEIQGTSVSQGQTVSLEIFKEGSVLASDDRTYQSEGKNEHRRSAVTIEMESEQTLEVQCNPTTGSVDIGGNPPDDSFLTLTKVAEVP